MKVQAFLSAPAERHAEQPLPSPGSPEHLILRFLHLEHFRFVSQAGFPPSCGKWNTHGDLDATASMTRWHFRAVLIDESSRAGSRRILGSQVAVRWIIVAMTVLSIWQ